jgi:hypothetical protein
MGVEEIIKHSRKKNKIKRNKKEMQNNNCLIYRFFFVQI